MTYEQDLLSNIPDALPMKGEFYENGNKLVFILSCSFSFLEEKI